MNVEMNPNNELIIAPETDFEAQFISQVYGNGVAAFVKRDLDPTVVLGIKLTPMDLGVKDGINDEPEGKEAGDGPDML